MTLSYFAQTLRQLRQKRLLSQAQLAKAACCSQKAVDSWEHDLRMPAFDAVVRLAHVLDVPITTFVDPAGPRDTEPPEPAPSPRRRGKPAKPAKPRRGKATK